MALKHAMIKDDDGNVVKEIYYPENKVEPIKMYSRKEHNEKAPHQAIITLSVEVMERLKDGRVSGIPIDKSSKLYTVTGKNLEECKEKVNEFIQRLNNESKKTEKNTEGN
jgi:hypothetical protein